MRPSSRKQTRLPPPLLYDLPLILISLSVLCLGLVMVASTSIDIAAQRFDQPFYYFWRQSGFAMLGVVLITVLLFIPTTLWQHYNVGLLFFGVGLLVLVLVPGIGSEINGSMRWLRIAGLNLQPSEPMKWFMILFLAGYLVRREREVRETFGGFAKPMALVGGITSLLLLEPDYGSTVVLFVTVLGMLFLAGVAWRQFLLWVVIVTLGLGFIVILAPYRIKRLTVFMNPWADPFNSGFQLTQALIAIGRGELWGVGLGNSVQKLTYLPEAHTDFLFAILAEELGLISVLVVIALFTFISVRAFHIAAQAVQRNTHYAAYVSYGIGLSLGLQASINLGVNMGVLPTKGLTLPLMSYGGSSMLVSCVMLGCLLRIDHENRLALRKEKAAKY